MAGFYSFILSLVPPVVLQNTIGVVCNLGIPHANLHAASNFEQIEHHNQNSERKHGNCVCAGSF